LNAEIVAAGTRGERIISVADFFRGPMETGLAPEELIVEARLPLPARGARFGFAEFSRRPGDYAQAMALVLLEIEDGIIAGPRIGVGGAEAVPRRIAAAETVLAGQAPSEALIRDAAEAAAAAIDPLLDPQIDRQYRRELVLAMVHRALRQAAL
jgi:carbon-monoxide dehydrogenase medium subunit